MGWFAFLKSIVFPMLKVNLAASFVRTVEGYCVRDAEDDLLPPFSSLTNDEDREKKARYRAPGTYNIVVNPSSFTDVEEYREFLDDMKPNSGSMLKGLPQRQQSMDSVQSRSSGGDFSDDPDIVILSKFEDDMGGLTNINTQYSRFVSSDTPTPSDSSCTSLSQHIEPGSAPSEAPNFLEVLYRDGVDNQLISHYNNFMRRSFAQVQRDSLGTLFGNDQTSAHQIIGQQAIGFPPVSDLYQNCTSCSIGPCSKVSTCYTVLASSGLT